MSCHCRGIPAGPLERRSIVRISAWYLCSSLSLSAVQLFQQFWDVNHVRRTGFDVWDSAVDAAAPQIILA